VRIQLTNSLENVGTGISQAHQQLQDVLAKQMEQVRCSHSAYLLITCC